MFDFLRRDSKVLYGEIRETTGGLFRWHILRYSDGKDWTGQTRRGFETLEEAFLDLKAYKLAIKGKFYIDPKVKYKNSK